MSRFGEFLVREVGIDPERVRKALEMQQTLGERLGSNLLDMGAVTPEGLLDALGRFHGTPTISSLDLRRISPVVIKQIPRKMAIRYKVIPFRLSGKTLSIASLDPGDLLVEDEIGFLSGCMVKTHVCLEVWVRLALEKYYGKPCSQRLKILVRRLAGAGGAAGARPATPTPTPPPPTAPLPASLQSGKAKSSKPKTAKPKTAKPEAPLFIELSAEDMALLGVQKGAAEEVPQSPELLPPPQPYSTAADASFVEATPAEPKPDASVSAESAAEDPISAELALEEHSIEAQAFQELVAESESDDELLIEDALADHSLPADERLFLAAEDLQQATMRDEIADVLFAFAEPYLHRRMMLINRKGKIVGWRGEGEGIDPKNIAIREIEIGEHEPSVFLGLKTAESYWSGPLPPLPPNQRLIEALGGTSSKDCVVLPITLRGKLVCYFYGDNLGDSVANSPIPDLRRLVGKAGIAFEVYILKNKIRLL